MFAIDHCENKPDIVCLSKGITGGFMAMGITAVSDKIYQAFYSDDKGKTFLHGHSYTGNALACSVANASLDLFEKEDVWQNIESISEMQKAFVNSISDHSKVRNARSFGTIAAVELEADGASSYFNSKGKEAYSFLLEKGIILRPLGNVIVLIPPYCISSKDLEYMYESIQGYLVTQ